MKEKPYKDHPTFLKALDLFEEIRQKEAEMRKLSEKFHELFLPAEKDYENENLSSVVTDLCLDFEENIRKNINSFCQRDNVRKLLELKDEKK